MTKIVLPHLVAENIDYDASREEINEIVEIQLSDYPERLMEMTHLTEENIHNMDNEAVCDHVHKMLKNNSLSISELFGISDCLSIPESDEWDIDSITDYISDETGWCINNYSLSCSASFTELLTIQNLVYNMIDKNPDSKELLYMSSVVNNLIDIVRKEGHKND